MSGEVDPPLPVISTPYDQEPSFDKMACNTNRFSEYSSLHWQPVTQY